MSHLSRRQDLGLLLVRAGLGATLAAHGSQKLFGWFGGHGLSGTSGGMEAMGFAPPKLSAVMAGLGEAGGGVLLALGLATPVAGAAAASTMLAAAAVHKPAGFFATEGGFEYTAVLGLTGAALAIGGPGHYSLDRALNDRLNRPWMAAAALGLLGSASAAIIARRQKALDSANPTSPDQVGEGEQAAASGA
ncbi:MAG TPA: DoxX family protein [Propionibacteriaceae bacterium]|nr:DoxX family protein [Propionibacteriaceae bacterium]